MGGLTSYAWRSLAAAAAPDVPDDRRDRPRRGRAVRRPGHERGDRRRDRPDRPRPARPGRPAGRGLRRARPVGRVDRGDRGHRRVSTSRRRSSSGGRISPPSAPPAERRAAAAGHRPRDRPDDLRPRSTTSTSPPASGWTGVDRPGALVTERLARDTGLAGRWRDHPARARRPAVRADRRDPDRRRTRWPRPTDGP